MKDRHHGENIHKMEAVPERPAPSKLPDLLASSQNLPPGEAKRLTREASKRQAKKTANQTRE